MVLIRAARAIGRNPKKSLVAGLLAGWGGSRALESYRIDQFMRQAAQEAVKLGRQKHHLSEPLRHLTVILNPAAAGGGKKAAKLYEDYVAPLLHLAGIRVSLITTEAERQATELMSVMSNCDGVVLAGGSGTIHEAATGLCRRGDAAQATSSFPLAIVPLGLRNSTFKQINDWIPGSKLSHVQAIVWSTMAAVYGSTRPVDVLEVLGHERGQPVYALDSLEFGVVRDGLATVERFWFFGQFLKPLVAMWRHCLSTWPEPVPVLIEYSPPCSGCRKCYKEKLPHLASPPQAGGGQISAERRWWHALIPRSSEHKAASLQHQKAVAHYESLQNETCGVVQQVQMNVSNLIAQIKSRQATNGHEQDDPTPSHLKIKVHENQITTGQLISEGTERYRTGRTTAGTTSTSQEPKNIHRIDAERVTLRFRTSDSSNPSEASSEVQDTHQEDERWISIDGEPYESQSVTLRMLRDRLKIFAFN